MYSIFSNKSKKIKYLEEGEPPPKKIATEADTLIKKLSENQLKTNITLSGQLNQEKDFVLCETITDITGYVKGKTDLKNFQSNVTNVCEQNRLKSKGLSNSDIKVYREYIELGPKFWLQHKGVNKDALEQHLHEIHQVVNSTDNLNNCESTGTSSRHQEDYLNSLKPQSIETKLLKFATTNKAKELQLPTPMDELPDLEEQIMRDIREFSKFDIKKIRKKARSLGNKIHDLTETDIYSADKIEKVNEFQRKTLWDVKEKPANLVKKLEVIDKDKVYTCTPQNWYTIKDGRITKLNENKTLSETLSKQPNTEQFDTKKSKLTVKEIKDIPKFSTYEPGSPSRILFLKNLGKKVDEGFLRYLLTNFQQSYVVKLMSGRMKGQAFVEFQDKSQAMEGLEILNGVLVEGRPIVAQFGKKKES